MMHLRHSLSSFGKSENGTVAIIFGLILSAFLAFGGISIDQTRAFSAKAELQAAVDAASLHTARFMMKNPDADARAAFNQSFAANWASKASESTPVIEQFSTQDDIVAVIASTRVPTMFMTLLGHDMLDVSTAASVQFGIGDLELALVLDNTFSMNGRKLESLKDAATELVETVKPQGESTDNIKVSVVPFAQYVNVGLANRYESWISVPDDYSVSGETCSNVRPITDENKCSMQTMSGTRDGVSDTYETKVCDSDAYGPEEEQCSTGTTEHVWRGCVGSRNDPLDTQDSNYGSDMIIGLLDTWCPTAISPLSSAKSDVLDQIDGMTATGNTYIPAGVMWGWRTLSAIEPFTEGSSAGGNDVKKVMVLMTDGANTMSPAYPHHTGTDKFQADTLTTTACNNVKSDDIEIFTVTFDVDDNGIKTLMKNCASKPGNFYDASNGSELTSAFEAIGMSLAKLRLTN